MALHGSGQYVLCGRHKFPSLEIPVLRVPHSPQVPTLELLLYTPDSP
jgi:hypothetical protein